MTSYGELLVAILSIIVLFLTIVELVGNGFSLIYAGIAVLCMLNLIIYYTKRLK